MANHGSNAAAEAVASSSDLLCEILVLLPPEALLNFKIVCRKWYDLISSRQFGLEHTRRNSNPRINGVFLVVAECAYFEYLEFDKNYHLKSPCKFPGVVNNILNSCNGLLLVCANYDKFYVCNPITKHTMRIPNPVKRGRQLRNYVLGFDHSMPENYRIVLLDRLWVLYESYQASIDVYESETRAWRHSTTFLTSATICFPGVFWDGAAYWLDYSGEILISFDLKQDCVRETLLLPIIPMIGKGVKMYLSACQGNLYLLIIDLKTDFGSLRVYRMEQDHFHFSMKISIRLKLSFGSMFVLDSFFVTTLMGEEDKLFLVYPPAKIVMYNIKNQISDAETILPWKFHRYCAVYPYSESLAPV